MFIYPATRGFLSSEKKKFHLITLYVSLYLAQCTYWGHSPDRIGIWKCWRGETGVPREKPLRARTRTNNELKPYDAETGNRTRVALVGGECFYHLRHPCSLRSSPQTTQFCLRRKKKENFWDHRDIEREASILCPSRLAK